MDFLPPWSAELTPTDTGAEFGPENFISETTNLIYLSTQMIRVRPNEVSPVAARPTDCGPRCGGAI